jgi:hypothetical protein
MFSALLISLPVMAASPVGNPITSIDWQPRANSGVICLDHGKGGFDRPMGHPSLPGYVIKVLDPDNCTELLLGSRQKTLAKREQCYEAKVRINSRGYAPQAIFTLTGPVPQGIEEVSVELSKISKRDDLYGFAEETAQEWNDDNTSTGTTRLLFGRLESSTSDLEKTSDALFRLLYHDSMGRQVPSDKRVKTTGGKVTAALIKKAVTQVAESAALNTNNRQNTKPIEDRIKSLLELLGDERNNEIYLSEVRLPYEVIGDESVNFSTLLLHNTRTGKAVVVFLIEGTK